ncbi:STAS domain-containing protein [Dactylosporangium sp. NPDC000521]|uniref:STAS domain-containing protein n=1 Tax=Dactylosporangium sp. NPDC000521 TaxID=3363975 RepID=UPI0036ACAF93
MAGYDGLFASGPLGAVMQLSVSESRGTAVVSVSGELDVATTPELRQFLHACIDNGASVLIVDLTAVAFLDSTALSVFVGVHKRLRDEPGGLTLVSPYERLLRIFRMTGLDRVFTIVAELPDAPATEQAARPANPN